MVCPHCRTAFKAQLSFEDIDTDEVGSWGVTYTKCPQCNRVTINLIRGTFVYNSYGHVTSMDEVNYSTMVLPKGPQRPLPPPEVPSHIRDEYTEACLVLPDSPKASAALGRRCLQSLLRDAANVKPGDLSKEIQEVLDGGKLPSHLADSIDAVRNIGNFAAHPIKSQHTGEIVDVEPEEAEWNLDTLEQLFDFYYVLPAKTKAKRDALNVRLKEAGKPPVR